MRYLLLSLLLVAVTCMAPNAGFAKGTTTSTLVTVTGPGLETELVVTNQSMVTLLTLPMLADLSGGPVPAPAQATSAYLLTRYAFDAAGLHPLGSLRYDLSTDQRSGAVLYEDAAPVRPGQVAGHWFPASIPEAQIVRCFLTVHGAHLGQRTRPCPLWAHHWLLTKGLAGY